ncbi:MAG: STM4015 family protein [Clostridia bacterium]|nr:STM4015 family protein [Clostridia bacterium]
MIKERLALTYDEYEEGKTFTELMENFVGSPNAKEVEYLEVGFWGEPYDESSDNIVKFIAENSSKLPKLKGIFIGDMESDECEISWIEQCDMAPLFGAFPQLEELVIKGSNNLRLSSLNHANLKKLVIICGGLGKDAIEDISKAQLPNLEHLELYLGEDNYGFDGSIEDIKPLMKKGLFPKLKYLGLKDSEIQDEIAVEIAEAPILEQLEVLDLSQGTLTDEGAQTLLNSSKIKNLKKLDLSYHYMSEGMMKKLKTIGIDVDVSDPQGEDEEYRYPAVTE